MTLSPTQIRKLLGEDAYPKGYEPSQPLVSEQCRRRGLELKYFVERMRRYESFIICRFLEGYTPEQIATFLSAHSETIRIRIRRAQLFPVSTRGQPPKGAVNPLVRYYRENFRQTGPSY